MAEDPKPPEIPEPTEAEVLSIMHDDDLVEYRSSSDLSERRRSMFQFYKDQWKAQRGFEEHSKQVKAARDAVTAELAKQSDRRRPDPGPENPHSAASIIVNGFPEVRRREEQEALRRQEELVARQEALFKAQQEHDEAQQRRDTIKLGQKIREMGHESDPEPAQPQYHPINDVTNDLLRRGLAADSRPDPSTSEPSILAKFWKLTESNFFMGGGLGIALAAYAFLLGGAPKFAILLLVLSWLVTTVAVYRHKFFEGRSRPVQIVGNIGISTVLAAVLVILWVLLVPTRTIPAVATDTTKPAASAPQQNEPEVKEFLQDKYQAIGITKTFAFFGDKNYGAVSFQGRFGLGPDVTTIVVIHSIDDNPGIVGDCLTAINNYPAIVDDLKAEMKKGRPEFIAVEVYPMLICHYDYSGKDIPPEKSAALKQLALAKHIFLRIEGPNGPK